MDTNTSTMTRLETKNCKRFSVTSAFILLLLLLIISGCATYHPPASEGALSGVDRQPDKVITQSLFNDRQSSISEQDIQTILDGHYRLPATLRVSLVNLSSPQRTPSYWGDENSMKNQQRYLDLFSQNFRSSHRVVSVGSIPDILIAQPATFISKYVFNCWSLVLKRCLTLLSFKSA